MARGGRAWRGWFPVGGELTSGRPDRKEGIYFGAELGPDDPRVSAGLPLHGPNLFPARPAGLRDAVLAYMAAMTDLGHLLASAIARALGLADDWFATHLTADPTVLFRIFHYPPAGADPRATGRGGVVGCGRAHRLRAADDPPPGRHRWLGGAHAQGLDRSAADPRVVRLQPGRHAGAHDGRALPLDPTPGAQPRPGGPGLVRVLLRSVLGCRDRGPAAGGKPGTRRPRRRGGTAPTSTSSPGPTATTYWPRWPRSFPTWVPGSWIGDGTGLTRAARGQSSASDRDEARGHGLRAGEPIASALDGTEPNCLAWCSSGSSPPDAPRRSRSATPPLWLTVADDRCR